VNNSTTYAIRQTNKMGKFFVNVFTGKGLKQLVYFSAVECHNTDNF